MMPSPLQKKIVVFVVGDEAPLQFRGKRELFCVVGPSSTRLMGRQHIMLSDNEKGCET